MALAVLPTCTCIVASIHCNRIISFQYPVEKLSDLREGVGNRKDGGLEGRSGEWGKCWGDEELGVELLDWPGTH